MEFLMIIEYYGLDQKFVKNLKIPVYNDIY